MPSLTSLAVKGHTKAVRGSRYLLRQSLLVCTLCLGMIDLGGGQAAAAQSTTPATLKYGNVYGTIVSEDEKTNSMDGEASKTILVFTDKDGHRSLVSSRDDGDFLALLEPGKYCLSAFSNLGEEQPLQKQQLRCITIVNGKDLRLDVLLSRKP